MPAFPDGHFYSPVIDPQELRARRQAIWAPRDIQGFAIDYRADAQNDLLRRLKPFAADFDFPRSAADGGFYLENGKFEGLDARLWFCLLRHWSPRRVIEVGSGFSSLLALDVIQRFLPGQSQLTCIEPYPESFLKALPTDRIELIEAAVQEVPMKRFDELEGGDVLFIDSSHVSKTGSDVNFLLFEVLPRLAEGVLIHIHDIFLPDEYPVDWVLGEQRSWNEQYLVRALLTYSYGFEILIGSHFAARWLREAVEDTFGEHCGGGSLWLRKVVPAS